MELPPDGQTCKPQPCFIQSTFALMKLIYKSVYLWSIFNIWQSYLSRPRVLKHTTGMERITPCPFSLNEKSGSSEIKKENVPVIATTLLSTVWVDINTKMRMTSSYVQPNHHKWHDINSTRQLSFFFFLGQFSILLEFVVLCPCYLALQTLLSLWGRGAERWQ